jgi:dTDP-4-dehydrorhamnose 3,5-epimerase
VTFKFEKLNISEIISIQPQIFSDKRGFFFESFKQSEFIANGINKKFVQDNYSYSDYGVLRGLHYQTNPKAQAKLVTALKGEIFDVAVDIRKNSPTFGKWVGEKLLENNHKFLYIPEGFAHGFCVLSDHANVLYKTSEEYSPSHEKGIMWNDEKINISWPIENPIISDKDNKLLKFEKLDSDFIYENKF